MKLVNLISFCLILFSFVLTNEVLSQGNAVLVYDNAQTTSFEVPADVTEITVECYGAGGGGGRRTSGSNARTNGGGGGAYAKSTLTVVPGETYQIVVGAGGQGFGTAGQNSGAATVFGNDIVKAAGGGGVAENGSALNQRALGGSASNSIGDIVFSGGDGAAPASSNPCGGGGAAGPTGDGGNGQLGANGGGIGNAPGGNGGSGATAQNSPGLPGLSYGGGGGGAFRFSAGTHNGGAGADGAVIISYFDPNCQVAEGTHEVTTCQPFEWIDGVTYTESNNTATFTIQNGAANGCDSIVTLNLTFIEAYEGIDAREVCGSFTWIDGVTYDASTTIPTFLKEGVAANGCDSLLTLNLVVKDIATGVDVQEACGSFEWIDGVTYTEDNNTATFTIENGAVNGCDSIVTLDLTILPPVEGVDVQEACGSFEWIDGVTYTESNNTATFTIENGAVNGCDSIVTLNLTIADFVTAEDVHVICGESFEWIDGVVYTENNNTAEFIFENGAVSGCDSIVKLNLTFESVAAGEDVYVICGESFEWIDGVTYTADNNEATYIVENGASNGCDSIVTLNLTFLSPVEATQEIVSCGAFIWIDGNTYEEDNFSATYTIENGAANGCDSIITLNLTVNHPVTAIDEQRVCGDFTWIDGNTYTESTNTPTFTFENGAANGCDSIVKLNLTIADFVTADDIHVVCGESFEWIDGVTYTEDNDEATFLIENGAANGCDSVVNLKLTLLSPAQGVDEVVTCGAFTWIDGETYTESNTSATFVIENGAENGCDSIVSLNLTILPVSQSVAVVESCEDSYTWINGETYTSATDDVVYVIENGAANGCDSLVVLDLTFVEVDNTVTQNGEVLTANQAGAIYQWVNCATQEFIEGANEATFVAEQNGLYAVQITYADCEEMSACYTVDNLNVQTQDLPNVNVYPNPTTNQVNVDFGQTLASGKVTLYDATGRNVMQMSVANQGNVLVDLSTLQSGMYWLEITNQNIQNQTVKVIKE